MTQPEHTYLRLQLTVEQFQAAHIACQAQGFTDLEGYLRTCLQQLISSENVMTSPALAPADFGRPFVEMPLQYT